MQSPTFKLSVRRSHRWFSQNGLVVNPEKSEAVLMSTRASSSPLTDVNVTGCVIPLADTVKLLDVILDFHLTFDSHVHRTYGKSAYFHIRALMLIRSSLSTDMAKLLHRRWYILYSAMPTQFCITQVRRIC